MKVDADAVTASAKGYTGRLAAGLSSGCRLWACASLLQGTMCWAPGLLAGLQCWSDISDFYADYPISVGYR